MGMKYFNIRLTKPHKEIKNEIKNNLIKDAIVAGFEKESIKGKATLEHAHLILHTTKCEKKVRQSLNELGYNGPKQFSVSAPYTEDVQYATGLQSSMRYACKGWEEGKYDVEILESHEALDFHTQFWAQNKRDAAERRANNKKKTTSIIKLVTDHVSNNKGEFVSDDGTILDEKLTGYIVKKYIEYRKPHTAYNVESLFNVCMGILNPNDEINYIMNQMKFYNNGGRGSCSSTTSKIELNQFELNHKREKVQDKVHNYFASSNITDDLEFKLNTEKHIIYY